MSLADLILKASDLPKEHIETPEWPEADGKLFGRVLTGMERRELEKLFTAAEDQPDRDPRAFVCGKAIVDEFGGRIFSDEQITALSGKSSVVLDRCYDVIMRISRIRETKEEAKLEKKDLPATTEKDSSIG
jgi:hypothetical protein